MSRTSRSWELFSLCVNEEESFAFTKISAKQLAVILRTARVLLVIKGTSDWESFVTDSSCRHNSPESLQAVSPKSVDLQATGTAKLYINIPPVEIAGKRIAPGASP